MKRLLSIFAVLTLIVMLVVMRQVNGAVASFAPIYGDANGDHSINMADVTTVEHEILGLAPLTAGADANINGSIDMGDVVRIERQILHLAPIYGDADGNLTVNQADIQAVEDMILGKIPKTAGADANRDGFVTMSDVTAIERMVN